MKCPMSDEEFVENGVRGFACGIGFAGYGMIEDSDGRGFAG